MSRDIEEKVVELQLHNDNFEANAKQSLETLSKLEKSLQLENGARGLTALQNACNGFTMNVITGAVDEVQNKFSLLEHMAIGALENIGVRAEQAMEKYLKAFTVDNIAAGWQKFGEKTTSVATLVSQLNPKTGENYSLEEVNEQLEKLNWFTDETSYNFTDMVSNIAKFTATGQDLETSVQAMEGIALWASKSGQNAQKASMAMYQLAQAMGKGALKYDDYKSIQNASMDTQEFRNKALEVAEALGKVRKEGDGAFTVIGENKTFKDLNEMFSSDALSRAAWFDTEVMMGTFNAYSAAVEEIYQYAEEHELTASEAIDELGDKVDAFGLTAFKAGQEARTFSDVVDSVKDAVSTGWMNTFEMIIGNYEQARDLWSGMANELYDIFAEPLNKQNLVLGMWNENGGRDSLINGFKNLYEAFQNFVVPIKSAWDIIFPPKSHREWAESLLKLTQGFEKVTGYVKEIFNLQDKGGAEFLAPLFQSSELLRKNALAVGGFLGVFDPLTTRFEDAVSWASKVADGINNVGKTVNSATDGAKDLLETAENIEEVVNEVIRGDWGNGEARFKALEEAGYNWKVIQNRVNEVLGCEFRYKDVAEETNGTLSDQNKTLNENSDALSDAAEKIKEATEPTIEAIKASGKLERIFLGIFSVIDIGKQILSEALGMAADVLVYIWKVAASPLLNWIVDVLANIGDMIFLTDIGIRKTKPLAKIFGTIGDALKKLIDIIVSAVQAIKPFTDRIFGHIADAIGIITSKIQSLYQRLKNSGVLENVANAFKTIWESIKGFGFGALEVITGLLGDFVDRLRNTHVDWDKVTTFFDSVGDTLKGFGSKAIDALEKMVEFFTSITGIKIDTSFLEDIKNGALDLTSMFDGLKNINPKEIVGNISKTLDEVLKTVSDWIEDAPGKIQKKAAEAWQTVLDFIHNFSLKDLVEGLERAGLAAVLLTLARSIIGFGDAISAVPKSIKEVLEGIGGVLTAYQNNLKAKSLKDIGEGIMFLAIAIAIFTVLDPGKMESALESVTLLMLVGAMLVYAMAEFRKAKPAVVAANGMLSPLQGFFSGVVGALKKGAKIAGLGVLIAGIGVGLAALFGVMIQVAEKMDQGLNINAAFNQIVGVIVWLGAIMLAYSVLTSRINKFGIGDALTIVGFVFGVTMIVDSIIKLASAMKEVNDMNSVMSSALAIGGIMVALGFAIKLGTENADKVTKVLGFIFALLAISKVIQGIVNGINYLAKLDTAKVLASAKAITLVIVAISLLTYFLGKNESSFGKGLVTLVALSAVLIGFGTAIVLLGQNAKLGFGGLLMIAAALTAVIAAAWLAEKVSFGLITLTASLLGIGLAAAALGAGAALVGVAIKTISEGIVAFFTALADIGKLMQERSGEILTGVLVIFAAILGAIILSRPQVVEAIATVVTAAAEGIAKGLPAILSSTAKIIYGLLAFLTAVAPGLVAKIGMLVLILINEIVVFIGNNTGKLRVILENLGAMLLNLVIEMIVLVLESAGRLIVEGIEGIVNMIPGVEVELSDQFVGFVDKIRDGTRFQMRSFGEEMGQEYANGQANGLSANKQTVQSVYDEYDNMLAMQKQNARSRGQEIGEATGEGEKYGAIVSLGDFSSLITDLNLEGVEGADWGTIAAALQEQGSDLSPYLPQGLLAGQNLVEDAGEQIAESGATSMQNQSQEYVRAGEQAMTAAAKGMSSATSKTRVATAAKGAVRSGAEGAKGTAYSSMYSVGSRCIDGIVSGLQNASGMARVRAAAEELSNIVAAAARKKAEVYSPSRVMMRIFKWIPIGAAKGIESTQYVVEEAATEMTAGVVSSMNEGIAAISNYIENGIDTEPTITPVLDLSQIQNGSFLANSLLSGIGVNPIGISGFTTVSRNSSIGDMIKEAVNGAVTDIYNSFADAKLEQSMVLEVPVNLDGKEIARVTAPYTRTEINRINRNISRKGGSV